MFGFNSCNRNNSQISPGQSWWTEFPSIPLRDCWVCCSGECQLLRTPCELIPTNYQSWKTNQDKVLVWPVESALIQDLQQCWLIKDIQLFFIFFIFFYFNCQPFFFSAEIAANYPTIHPFSKYTLTAVAQPSLFHGRQKRPGRGNLSNVSSHTHTHTTTAETLCLTIKFNQM